MKKYQTILADPPWAYEGRSAPWRSTTEPHYPLMPLQEIKDLPIGDLATSDAHLYLWAVVPMLEQAYEVVRAWKFEPWTALTWCKSGPGLGGGFRGNTEHLIVARRGFSVINPTCAACGGRARGARKCSCDIPEWRFKGKPLPEEIREPAKPFRAVADSTWYVAPRGRHSEKPELFRDLIEKMSRGPYLEAFARSNRLGWDTWGNESLVHVEIGETA